MHKVLLLSLLALPLAAGPIDGGACSSGTLADFLALTAGCDLAAVRLSNFSYVQTGTLGPASVSVTILQGIDIDYVRLAGPWVASGGSAFVFDFSWQSTLLAPNPHCCVEYLGLTGAATGNIEIDIQAGSPLHGYIALAKPYPATFGSSILTAEPGLPSPFTAHVGMDSTSGGFGQLATVSVSYGIVPEPATLIVSAGGLVLIAVARRRRRKL
jgi:hypothetical protein